MLFNDLKIAFRTLKKNKIYTTINILGLAVGIAAALLIFRMVHYELSFNKGFSNYDRTYRVVRTNNTPTRGMMYNTCTPLPAMEVIQTEISQLETTARVYEMWANITIPNPNGGAPEKKFGLADQQIAFAADPTFLDIFDFELLIGDRKTALAAPNSILLTKTWAEKCFTNWEEAIGQTVLIDNIVKVKVEGVLADLPANCDFGFPYLVSYKTLESNKDFFQHTGNWGSCSSSDQLFVQLRDNNQFEAASKAVALVGKNEYVRRSEVRNRHHHLQPLSELHFDSRYGNSGTHTTSKTQLKVLSFIGLLILLIACFNFINLATAQASLRAKEVGVRKTLGGRPIQLIRQFMTETGMIVFTALLIGALLALWSTPYLKNISEVPDSLPFFSQPIILLFLAGVGIAITCLAGFYPATVLSNYKPLEAIRSKTTKQGFGGRSLGKSLVVLQFVIAQALIIGALVTIHQLDYIQSKDLGFSKDLIYTFPFNEDKETIARQTALKQNLLQIPDIESVSLSNDPPFSQNTWQSNFNFASKPEDANFQISQKFVDADYMETYGIKLVAGKWLPASDTSRHCVVNTTTLKKLGITNPEEALGQSIKIGQAKLSIVGVSEDFHTKSLKVEYEPLLLTTRKEYYGQAAMKIRTDNIPQTIAAIENAFDKVLPEQIFNGNFFDEDIARVYENEAKLSTTCKIFGLLAIFISCLGLFGLATHAATQRVKEIGIRKVLGASIPNLIGLLSKDFLILVIIALVIAAPLAWYAMNLWLDNFVFRTNLHWWVFAIAGASAIFIAFLTVSYQAIRVAVANPIKALKTE